jgi:hypothetical protein
MADFALVHGGPAGACGWELLVPELERLGHRCTAMDLPISDPAKTITTMPTRWSPPQPGSIVPGWSAIPWAGW